MERSIRFNGKTIRRNSIGIYKGLLSDINDFSRFKLCYETKEPAYLFKKLENHYVFSGQRGELAISNNTSWISSRTDEPMIHYNGSTYQFHVLDKYILIFK